MNLGGMCRLAARYSDRFDEYVKTTAQDGSEAFEGEALHWFEIFRDAVNEAYFEISRSRLTPQCRVEMQLSDDRVIDLYRMQPEVCSICGVYRLDGTTDVEYVFINRTSIEVTGARGGETVIVEYHYLPQRLEEENDEPVFPESLADPSIYAALAVARVWQSERKMNAAQYWLSEYYQKLRSIRTNMKPMRRRRLPRTMFR